MRTKSQSSVNLKVIFIGCSILIFIVIFFARSNISSSSKPTSKTNLSQEEEETHLKPEGCPTSQQCTKMPLSLSDALVHYVTSNVTPQQTFDEISVSKRVLDKKSPCNFLVFGLGHDSLMWASLNHGGRTCKYIFLCFNRSNEVSDFLINFFVF